MSERAICFDVTHLVERMAIRAPSGIDRVDLAYGRHFAIRRLGPAIHYGLLSPHVLKPERIGVVVDHMARAGWDRYPDEDASSSGTSTVEPALAGVLAWLDGREAAAAPKIRHRQRVRGQAGLAMRRAKIGLRFARDGLRIPERAIYLNAAQLMLEMPWWFRWLDRRPDVTTVFLIHDLLPLDYPEYWKAGYRDIFQRRIDTALRYGRAFITTTEVVRQRLLLELRRQNLPMVPIHVAPLPSPLESPLDADPVDAALRAQPYFLIVGTIEPRKNHMLLLNVWRQLAASGRAVPKLIIVGSRGWENEQVLDALDRSVVLRPHILEVAGLPAATLHRLMRNTRAVLLPSFAEGYGLPLVEALSIGTPVVAADIGTFREVGSNCAHYLKVLDGLGWRDAVVALADPTSPLAAAVRAKAQSFRAPSWVTYFAGIEAFLRALP